MDDKNRQELIVRMNEIMDRGDLSVDSELSSLGGMLYAAVIKRILNDEWQDGYVEFLGNMRTELLEQWGEIDEESCLTELSAAQISGPALESEYSKTFDAVDLAGEMLDVDTTKLNTPKYISKGRELAESFKKYPKKILAAALVGGILFCGQPGGAVLMGPKPAEASSVLGSVFCILASQMDVSFKNGNFEVGYDAENAGDEIARYAARKAKTAVRNGIENLPDRLERSSDEGTAASYALMKKMDESETRFNADEKVTILKGVYMLREFNGLSPEELVICMLMVNPELSNQRLGDVCSFMAKNAEVSGKRITFGAMEASGALSILKKAVPDFDRDEAMLSFLASAAKISDRLITDENSKNARAMTELLNTAYWSVKRYYNNTVITNMARRVLDRQTGRGIGEIDVSAVISDRTPETDTSL